MDFHNINCMFHLLCAPLEYLRDKAYILKELNSSIIQNEQIDENLFQNLP